MNKKNKYFIAFGNVFFLSFLWCLIICFPAAAKPDRFEAQTRVVERGANHKTVEYATTYTNLLGIVKTNYHRYTVLENGIHRFENGAWVEADDTIEAVPGGAVARKTSHKVEFSANINTSGAIKLSTPDQKKLRFHPIALTYVSAKTGKSVTIGRIKDSQGWLLPPNRVLFEDAFEGKGVKASIVYTVTKGGIAQDVIYVN